MGSEQVKGDQNIQQINSPIYAPGGVIGIDKSGSKTVTFASPVPEATPVQRSPASLTWAQVAIVAGVALLVGGATYLLLPIAPLYRAAIAGLVVAAVSAAMAYYMNPALWYRRTIGLVIATWALVNASSVSIAWFAEWAESPVGSGSAVFRLANEVGIWFQLAAVGLVALLLRYTPR